MGDSVFDPADMELDMVDEVEPIIKKAIEENLAKAEYRAGVHMENLSDKVHDYILKTLVNEVKKPLKYVIRSLCCRRTVLVCSPPPASTGTGVRTAACRPMANQTIHSHVRVRTAMFLTQDPLDA